MTESTKEASQSERTRFWVWGLGFWVWGLGFGVWNFGVGFRRGGAERDGTVDENGEEE